MEGAEKGLKGNSRFSQGNQSCTTAQSERCVFWRSNWGGVALLQGQHRYVDVTSEYPYVNKYSTYPMGHPEIFLEPDDQAPASYYGILTVDILPPYNL